MEEMYNQLLITFKKQIKIYEDMLEVATKKTQVVVEGKVSKLEELVKKEQDLIVEIADIENEREEISNKIADALNIDKKDFNISNLIKHLKQPHKDEIEKNQKKMLLILDELKNTNELNRKLIQHALEYIEFSINVMTNTSSQNNTYQNQGRSSDGKDAKNIFDVKL